MRIELNGRPQELDDGTTLSALIDAITGSARGSAVAVDGTVVPRSDWAHRELREGQSVEMITAVQGG